MIMICGLIFTIMIEFIIIIYKGSKYFMIMICGLIFTIMIEFIIIIYKGLAKPV